MSQQGKFPGGQPNYGMNHMNPQQLRQQQMNSMNPLNPLNANPNKLNPSFNRSFNQPPPPQQQQQQQQRPQPSTYPPPNANPQLSQQQLQYQQRLMEQRLMAQRLMAQKSPYNSMQPPPPPQQQQQQQQQSNIPTSTSPPQAQQIGSINMNAMSPQQRHQYLRHFQQQRINMQQQAQAHQQAQQQAHQQAQQQAQQHAHQQAQQQAQQQQQEQRQAQRRMPSTFPPPSIPPQGVNIAQNTQFNPHIQRQPISSQPPPQQQQQPKMNMNAPNIIQQQQQQQQQQQIPQQQIPQQQIPQPQIQQTQIQQPQIAKTINKIPQGGNIQSPQPQTTDNAKHTHSNVDTTSQSSIPSNNLYQFVKSQYPILPNRKFIPVSTPQWNDQLRQIRVVSFNVMPKGADFKNKLQRNDGLQGYRTRPNYYSWGKRGPLLIEELKKGMADIICLQGCDQFEYFQEKLSPRGFVGVYERTQQPLLTKSVYFGDGLAIFWRTEKFELSGRERYSLGDNRYVSNIALLARLKRRSPFINPMPINKLNIVYENDIKYFYNSYYCVLANNKYLYLYENKKAFITDNKCEKWFDLDLFERISTSKDNTFQLIPKKNKLSKKVTDERYDKPQKFQCGDINICLMWSKYVKTAQIGVEIDVWNTHLIDGYSISNEYQRVQQSQELFDCMAKASVIQDLPNKNIGSIFNPYASSNHMKFYEPELDKKRGTSKDTEEETKRRDDGEEKESNEDLSQLFKKMMETRINTKKEEMDKNKIKPLVIDPNIKDEDNKTAEEQEEAATGIDDDFTKKQEDILKKGPTQLHRPVIVCCDIESNAWGDARYQIPPLCYSYLTMRSRTTQNNPLYAHSMQELRNDQNYKFDRHTWFLQSAYALGFQREPELTSFSRYWPHEISTTDDFTNNITAQTKDINFSDSIEICKCSDLILFSPQHFRVLKLLEPLHKQWIYSKWNKTLPNIDYPSDHTMIAVQFELAIPTKPVTNAIAKFTAIAPNITHAPTTPNNMSINITTTPTPNINNTPTPTNHPNKAVHINNPNASIATSALPTAPLNYTPTGQTGNPYQYSPFANQAQNRFNNMPFQRK